MSTNLTKGEPSVHQHGLLWKLVRASMTIVGLVPPVYHDGELLIDGGYLNNMPVDVMRGLGVETVRPLRERLFPALLAH
jgi:lysophospholipid hydrolase